MLESAQLIINWFPNPKEIYHLADTSKDFNALVRRIQIIGEVSKRISSVTKDRLSTIDWKAISGTRDVLVHNYDEINYEILVNIVEKELPKLINELKQLRNVLEDEYYADISV